MAALPAMLLEGRLGSRNLELYSFIIMPFGFTESPPVLFFEFSEFLMETFGDRSFELDMKFRAA